SVLTAPLDFVLTVCRGRETQAAEQSGRSTPNREENLTFFEVFEAQSSIQLPSRLVACVDRGRQLPRSCSIRLMKRFGHQLPAEAVSPGLGHYSDVGNVPAVPLRHFGEQQHADRRLLMPSEPPPIGSVYALCPVTCDDFFHGPNAVDFGAVERAV